MNTAKKIWDFIDGNKTIIFLTLNTALSQAVKYEIMPDTKAVNYAIGLTLALGTGALGHHIKKGYFTTKKGK